MLGGTAKVRLMLFPNRGLNLSIGVTPLSQYKPTGQAPAIQNRRTDASGNRSVKLLGSLGYGGQQST